MKIVIIGVIATIGILGGAASLFGDNKAEDAYTQVYSEPMSYENTEAYSDPTDVDHIKALVEMRNNVEYISFITPMEIRGYRAK